MKEVFEDLTDFDMSKLIIISLTLTGIFIFDMFQTFTRSPVGSKKQGQHFIVLRFYVSCITFSLKIIPQNLVFDSLISSFEQSMKRWKSFCGKVYLTYLDFSKL